MLHTWDSSALEVFFFSPNINVFNHLFMSAWSYNHLFYTFYSQFYNPMLLYFFVAPVALALAIGSSFIWLLSPSTNPHQFFNTFYFLELHKTVGLYCIISCSSLGISHFFEEPWSLSLENGTRNQELGAMCPCWHRGIIPFRPTHLPEQQQKIAYINTCLYKYLSICLISSHLYLY